MSDSDVVPSSLGGPGPPRRWVARVEALQSLLAIRERELLALQGPCSTADCRLHYAHNGPCDFRKTDMAAEMPPTPAVIDRRLHTDPDGGTWMWGG